MGFVCDFDGAGFSLKLPKYALKFVKHIIAKVPPNFAGEPFFSVQVYKTKKRADWLVFLFVLLCIDVCVCRVSLDKFAAWAYIVAHKH